MKEWLFYIIVTWASVVPLVHDSQKTIMLQFDSKKECEAIATQVNDQIKATNDILRVKQIGCYSCTSVFEPKRCLKKG